LVAVAFAKAIKLSELFDMHGAERLRAVVDFLFKVQDKNF
jgi:hypothetical protein